MAGDWIPYLKNLRRKPKTLRIRRLTGMRLNDVVVALLDFWSWADDETEDGILSGLTLDDLSDVFGRDVRSDADTTALDDGRFVRAMSEVGWLHEDEGGLIVPHFEKWMDYSAKARLSEARRKRIDRKRHQNVRQNPDASSASGGQNPDKSVTTGQDSTVQNKKSPLPPPRGEAACPENGATPPSASPGTESKPVMIFPCLPGKKAGPYEWPLDETKLAEYQESYPGVDVLAECKKARQWCVDNQAKRKTHAGMPAFLSRWLANVQNRGGPSGFRPASPLPGKPGIDELIADVYRRDVERQEGKP